GLVNDLAVHVVDILGNDGTDGLLYSATFGVVSVTGGRGRAVPERAIHLNGAILRVIAIGVVGVVSHVAGRVILISAVDGVDEPIGSVRRGVERAATPTGDGLIGAIPPRVISPGQAGAAGGVAWRGHAGETVQLAVGVGAAERSRADGGHGGKVAVVGRAE